MEATIERKKTYRVPVTVNYDQRVIETVAAATPHAARNAAVVRVAARVAPHSDIKVGKPEEVKTIAADGIRLQG